MYIYVTLLERDIYWFCFFHLSACQPNRGFGMIISKPFIKSLWNWCTKIIPIKYFYNWVFWSSFAYLADGSMWCHLIYKWFPGDTCIFESFTGYERNWYTDLFWWNRVWYHFGSIPSWFTRGFSVITLKLFTNVHVVGSCHLICWWSADDNLFIGYSPNLLRT